MKATQIDRVSHNRGYVSAAQLLGAAQADILAPGSRNLLISGADKLEAFKGLSNPLTGGRLMFNFSDKFASLNDYGVVTAKGSIFMLAAGRTMGFIGAGAAYYNGASLSQAAIPVLQFLLYRNGSYTDALSGPFQAGLPAPSSPPIVPMTSTLSTPGKVTGAVAIQITRIRSATGGESNASTFSPVVVANQQSIWIGPFPSLLTAAGQDRWGIYGTFMGFGTKGPTYFIKEVKESDLITVGADRYYEIEWTDADLTTTAILAPIDNYPPPNAQFGVELGGHVILLGCDSVSRQDITLAEPGNGIAISLQGYPEAFPPTGDYRLSLPEPPLFVVSRAAEGMVYVFCANSVHVLVYTGGSPPVQLQTLTPSSGVAAPHAQAFVDGKLHMATGTGLVRLGMGGEIQREWAADLSEPAGFTPANVAMGYDGNQQQLVVCHGNLIFPLNVAYEKWGAPIDINAAPISIAGTIVAAVTVQNQLKLCVKNGTAFTLYDFNIGTTGSHWIAVSGWLQGLAAEFMHTITGFKSAVRHDNLTAPDVISKFYQMPQIGKSDNTSLIKTVTHTLSFAGLQNLRPPRLNIRNIKGYQFSQEATGLASGPVETVIEGTVSRMRR